MLMYINQPKFDTSLRGVSKSRIGNALPHSNHDKPCLVVTFLNFKAAFFSRLSPHFVGAVISSCNFRWQNLGL
jgi:hypothetical protein